MPRKKKTVEIVEEPVAQTEAIETTIPSETEETPKESTTKEKPTKKKASTKVKKSVASETPEKESSTSDKEKLGVADKRRNTEHILTINGERSVKTKADRYNDAVIDIRESLQNGRILTDTIDGIEEHYVDGVGKIIVAVLNHGDIKVCIRLEDAVIPPRRTRGVESAEGHQYMLTKRLGAEIDYVIIGIDNEANIAVGSRLKAMEAKRKQFYFKEDREGNKQLYPDVIAEARIVAVIQKGIFVEIFGAETFIPLEELSYQRMFNAEEQFAVGERVLVKIQDISYDMENYDVSVKASVKRTEENPAIKAIKGLQLKQRYVGTVTQVDVEGVFVKLNCGIDCKCKFPPRGRPVRGSKVTVAITWIDQKNCRVWGNIISYSAVL